jgi:hypothetical protein
VHPFAVETVNRMAVEAVDRKATQLQLQALTAAIVPMLAPITNSFIIF